MFFRPFALVASFAVLFVSANASAHAVLVNPKPVTTDDNAKSGPCGCYFGAGPEDPTEDSTATACPANYTSTQVMAGSKLQVAWKETVNHTGKFRVSLSTKPINLVTRADLNDAAAILYEADDTNTVSGGMINTTITVPNVTCTNCVIQMRQFMAGAAEPYYYSCAAIDIVDPNASSSSSSSSTSSTGGGGFGGATGSSGTGGVPEDYDIIAGPAQTFPTQPAGMCAVSTGADKSSSSWWVGIVGLFVLATRRRR